jgi:sulfhydrogenase subunit alpha
MSMPGKTRTLNVDYLARVEGEGAMHITVEDGKVTDALFRIFEPPRFFEAFMRGRRFDEAPDITARICGICPVAYQMSSVHAMEDAMGVTVGGALRELRRLIYCGEWIESHVLHAFMLHAPDFLGYPDAIVMAQDHPALVEAALRMKKAGNEIVTTLAGREIHPINVRVGGFYRVPTRAELDALVPMLTEARDLAIETTGQIAALPMPEAEHGYEFVTLSHPDEYPFNEGRIVSSGGLDITAHEYEDHFREEHVERSNALHSTIIGRGAYLVGPMARFNLCYDRLSENARACAREAGLEPVCRNPFQSIALRMVETVHAFDEALRIIGSYERPERPFVEVTPRAGVGSAATEAPRGLLYHRYEIDDEGAILDARIVPPTSQNQLSIESDLRAFVTDNIELPDEELSHRCEQLIRNYDPCISCATHFLKLEIERR